jgi:hypothetical protein
MKSKAIACDVLVVGAGISGIAAAISSSRCQAKTILIEKNNLPGGLSLDCQHHYICGLYPENTGIAKEIISGLQKLNPQNKFTHIGKLSVFYFQPKNLASLLPKLLKKEKNLKVFYGCQAVSVEKKKNSIASVKVQSKQLNLCLRPKSVIDATGDGAIIKLSQAQYKLAPAKSRQLAGFTFQVRGLTGTTDILPIRVSYYLTQAVQQKKLPTYLKFTKFTYGQTKNSGMIKLNLPAKDAQRGIRKTKKYASLIHAYLRKYLPEFKKSRIYQISTRVHEREGLRLDGKYTLTEQEVLGAKKFPHPAAKGFWPIEFWDAHYGQKITYLKNRKFYEIPLGCLKSKNIDNLFATGKCISATARALASSRVMGTCIYLGEAAGNAAAMKMFSEK